MGDLYGRSWREILDWRYVWEICMRDSWWEMRFGWEIWVGDLSGDLYERIV